MIECGKRLANKGLIGFVSLFLLFFVCIDVQASENRRDGNWWNSQSEIGKLMYIEGFFDGMDYQDGTWDFALLVAEKEFDPKLAKYASDTEKFVNGKTNKDFSHITVGQLRDGFDKIYSNYENRRIEVRSAMTIVLRSIDGTSDEELNKIILYHRKKANE